MAWRHDRQETPLAQVPRPGESERVPQQALRREEYERPWVECEQLDLAAQDVEILGGAGAVGDPQVVFRRHLQEALNARAGVLRPLTLVAVRKQHHECRVLLPFGAR